MAFFEADADSTALKATQDDQGNKIASTYIKGLSASGTTITMTKGNGETATITTQDTTYSLGTATSLGLTKLYTGTGQNIDGTMTQSALNTALNSKSDTNHNHDSTYLKTTANAASATKLVTSRTIQTDLASSASASFDGTNNITPGVIGILPMTNGGLGTTSAEEARKNLIIAPIYNDSAPTTNIYDGLIWIESGS